jgi:tRNA(Ile2) C34 agmatinyltransferase TiaS
MRILIGIDDTDVLGAPIGTGRLARMFEAKLPAGAKLWGALRHQLLIDPRIPYTSHNSPACLVVEIQDLGLVNDLSDRAIAHIKELASPGSDPGLCVARADAELSQVIAFGLSCTQSIETQDRARSVADAAGIYLAGLGGTEDGVIGATAAVGLTAYGWSGRFLEYGRLRDLPDPIRVDDLVALGIVPVALDQNASVPASDALIVTNGWLSPRLWGGRAVVPIWKEDGCWIALGKKSRDAEVAE